MKRIPLVLTVLIGIISIAIIIIFLTIPLSIIWLLGGYKPFSVIADLFSSFNDVVFNS